MARKRRRVALLPRADRDIDDHLEYLALEAGVAAARRFLDAVRATLERLSERPEIGSARRFIDHRLEGVRLWPVRGFRRHLVFYRLRDERLEVLRVLHGARDVESSLDD